MKVVVCLLVMGLVATGCAVFKKKPAAGQNEAQQGPIVTPALMASGKVIVVNPTAQFAVLNFPIGSMPAIGQQLEVYRGGLKVGEVKVTGPQQDDNTAADFIIGEPRVGDQVRPK